MPKKNQYTIDQRVTWAQALRDLGINSMMTGQFPFFCLFMLTLVVVISLPSSDVSLLIHRLVDHLIKLELIAYILWLSTVFLWFIHVRYLSKSHAEEYKRIAAEKTYLQEILKNGTYKSSEE